MEKLEKFHEYRDEVEKFKEEHPEIFYTPNETATRNAFRIEQGIEYEYDLVEMISHQVTCEKCAIFQGRIYSISGKDKRFPPLSVVLPEGTHQIHLGCKHIFMITASAPL